MLRRLSEQALRPIERETQQIEAEEAMIPDSLILALLTLPVAYFAVRGLKNMISETRREAGL